MLKYSLNSGAKLGLFLLLVMVALPLIPVAGSILVIPAFIGVHVWRTYKAQTGFRDEEGNGVMGFGKALLVGLGSNFFASLILLSFFYISLKMADPDMLTKATEQVAEQMLKDGAAEESVDKVMSQLDILKEPNSLILLMAAFFIPFWMFYAGVISLLTAIGAKKEPGDFDQFLKENQ